MRSIPPGEHDDFPATNQQRNPEFYLAHGETSTLTANF
jgi:hypothetical protein